MEKINPKETIIKKSVRLLQGLVAAGIITGSVYAEEKKDTGQDSWVKLEEKMNQNESDWLTEFKIDSIKIGKVKNHSRGVNKQLGLYKDGVHMGDISSEFAGYSKDDFIRDVANILDKNDIKYKLNEASDYMVEVELEDSAIKRLAELKNKGLKYGKVKNKDGNDMLVIQGNEGADFFNLEIDLKNDHNPNTSVKIYAEGGLLEVEGNDGQPFRYEIYTDKDSVKIRKWL
jgi:hypothetical protein